MDGHLIDRLDYTIPWYVGFTIIYNNRFIMVNIIKTKVKIFVAGIQNDYFHFQFAVDI